MQDDQQPGQVIIPHASNSAPTPGPDPSVAQQAAQTPPEPGSVSAPALLPQTPMLPEPVAQQPQQASPVAAEPTMPAPMAEAAPESGGAGWQFHQEEDATVAQHDGALPENVSWTAAQFTEHEKSFGWYGALLLGGAAASALIYFLTRDKITTGVIIFAVVAFCVFASRKPKSEEYTLSATGLQVGQKIYAFHDFKTFSIVDEGGVASIVFMPLKRFMPPLTIYTTPDVEDRVVDFLSAYLPLSEHKTDAVEGLLRRIRF
jgi:hypothetical protein